MYKRFTVKENKASAISADINSSLKNIFATRGIDTDDKLESFLSGDSISIRPEIFKDIDIACARVFRAIEEGERIGIFGDYDADGICATAILYRYLIEIGADVVIKIPTREEGYGITKDGVLALLNAGVSLIITVDNGIVAFDEVLYAKELGIDVIITDHHKPRETLPEALAVINPHCTDAPFKEYSGGFVALLFAAALEGDFETIFSQYGYLAAITTVADVMPITHDNRVIVRKGLMQMAEEEIPAIDALLEQFEIKKKDINGDTIGYKIAPAINSAGRIGDPIDAFVLLATDDEAEAVEYAIILSECNTKRREIEAAAVVEIEKNEDIAVFSENCILIFEENLPEGIIGIIAARFIERYKKSTVVITKGGGILKGSVRALSSFGILDCLKSAEDLLLKFGGHSAAAGFSLLPENFEEFQKLLLSHKPNEEVPIFESIEVDAIAQKQELTISFAKSLEMLSPFGRENEEPVFLIENAVIKEISPLSNGKFVKLSLSLDESFFDAVSFSYSFSDFPLCVGNNINLTVAISVNRYRENEYLSLRICDISQSAPEEGDLALLSAVQRGEDALYPPITREDFATIYRLLSAKSSLAYDIYDISISAFNTPRLFVTYTVIEIFIEANLTQKKKSGGKETIAILKSDKKVVLEETTLYKKLFHREES